jgi:predicted ferric reductase
MAIIIYITINLALFLTTFQKYRLKRIALFKMLGYGVVIARSCGACLRFNTALILVPVLRNMLKWLRSLPIGNYLPIDKNIMFHKKIAFAIGIFTAGHTVAHCFNVMNLTRQDLRDVTTDSDDLESRAIPAIRDYIVDEPVPYYRYAFTLLPTATGWALLIVMLLMYSGAWKRLRNSNFENFWYSHHLFILFYLFLIPHGLQNLLENSTLYYYVTGPLVLYIIERLVRFKRASSETILLKVRKHAGGVLEVQMKTPNVYKAGQYAFFHVPLVSRWEWHPFTISSAPEESFLSCHMKMVGDWTKSVGKLFNPNDAAEVVYNTAYASNGTRLICVDGGFGAPSEDFTKFSCVMLVGAGIGVTPYSSILKSIGYNLQRNTQKSLLKKIHFYWIMREKNGFEWFAEKLRDLESVNTQNILVMHNYMTGQMSPDEIKKIMYNEDGRDPLTGLKDNPTHYGRPNWAEIFKEHAETYKGLRIGVFFCGPAVLSKQLYSLSRVNSRGATKFDFHKENF